jgi:broad specificity phosphatase PhoE
MTVEIIYETHATTIDNERGFATGWLPGELSDAGRQNARELGERRRDTGLAAVFVSDLRRAMETATIAFGATSVPVHLEPRLRECNYGDWNGMPVSSLAGRRAQYITDPFPGGQSYQDVVNQTRDLLRDISTDWDGSRVLFIAHSANRWALQHLLEGDSLEELVDAPFGWKPGWTYRLSLGWTGSMR